VGDWESGLVTCAARDAEAVMFKPQEADLLCMGAALVSVP